MSVQKDVQKGGLSYITGGIIKWFNYFGEKFGSFLKIWI